MRDWMKTLREAKGLTLNQAAKQAKCTVGLLREIEEREWITHPDIAGRIASVYGMTLEEYNMLIAKERALDALPEWVDPPTRDTILDEDRESGWVGKDD